MPENRRKFSFGRLIQNAFPVIPRDDANDVDLSPKQADDLVEYQLGQPSPQYLTELSFFVAHVTDNKPFSQSVYKNLLKAGIISAAPKPSTNTNTTTTTSDSSQPQPQPLPPPVTTAAIGKNFVNQLSHISVHAQRKVVGMLFFWEEECTRWKLLDQEEAEILKAIENGNAGNHELDMALRAVEMKKKLLPSQRAEPTQNISKGVGFDLPAYS